MVAIFAANDIRKHLLRHTHTRAAHTCREHTHMCVRLMCDQPSESPNHPINCRPPITHDDDDARARGGLQPLPALASAIIQRTHDVCVCHVCACVCVCVWVFIWYVVNPTGHIPHRRKGVSCHCHTRLPRLRTKANTHTHMSCDWSVCVSVCAGVKTMYSYFTLHYLPFRQTTTHFRDPPAPPSIHLVSSSPVFALRSPLLNIFSALPTPSAAA